MYSTFAYTITKPADKKNPVIRIDAVIVYAKAKEINKAQPQYQTLAVSFVNGVSLFGVFWVPVLFSSIVSGVGYEMAWLLGALVIILLILPIVRLK